jgi:hypothetical protein
MSLVSGLLSTFLSFYVQQTLSDLHRPEDVWEWLTSTDQNVFGRLFRTVRRRTKEKKKKKTTKRIPSLSAAAILTSPGRLLFFSIVSLFVALGIYLGSVYTAKIGMLQGRNANLAVLLFFIISTVIAASEAIIPLYSKWLDEQIITLERQNRARYGQLNGNPDNDNTDVLATTATDNLANAAGSTDVVIRQALEASIHAQEESLKAQKALLQLLILKTGEVLNTPITEPEEPTYTMPQRPATL